MYGNVDQKEPQSTDVIVDVHQRSCNMTGRDLFMLISPALNDETLGSNSTLSLVEKPSLARFRRHNIRYSQSYNNGNETFEEEDVAPGMNGLRFCTPFRNTCKSISNVLVMTTVNDEIY